LDRESQLVLAEFWANAVFDQWSRASLAIEDDVSLTGERIIKVLERPSTRRGLPPDIRADSGHQLHSWALDQWAQEHGVRLQFFEVDHADIESLMRGCAKNDSIGTSSFRSAMREARSKGGTSNTIANLPIQAWTI